MLIHHIYELLLKEPAHKSTSRDSSRLHKLYNGSERPNLNLQGLLLPVSLKKKKKSIQTTRRVVGERENKCCREVSRHSRAAAAPALLIPEAQWQQSTAEQQPHGTSVSRKSLDPYIVWSSRIILSIDKMMPCAWLHIHKYRASAHMLFPFSAFPLICKSCNLSLELTEPTSKPAVL